MLEKIRILINSAFGSVLYPVFSKLKHDRSQLGSAYKRVAFYLAMLSFPIFIGIAVTAHLFVPIVFGEQWVDSIIVFQVFSVSLIFKILTANISSPLLYSLNKPEVVFYIDLIISLLFLLILFLVASGGMIAILTAYTIYNVSWAVTYQYIVNKQFEAGISSYLKQIKTAALFSTIMLIVVIIFQNAASHFFSELFTLVFSIILGILVYYLLIHKFEYGFIKELKSVVLRGTFS